MKYPQSVLDEIRDWLLVPDVVSKRIKLTRRGREFAEFMMRKHESDLRASEA